MGTYSYSIHPSSGYSLLLSISISILINYDRYLTERDIAFNERTEFTHPYLCFIMIIISIMQTKGESSTANSEQQR